MLNQWIAINVELHELLTQLKQLDEEREKISIVIEKTKKITPEQIEQMQLSIKKYEELLSQVKDLKQQSQKLKSTIE